MIKIFKIQGNSLHPFVKDGQRVLCTKISKFTRLKIDDIVVFEKNEYGLMIKQIKSISWKGFFVQGTDAFSIDSRDFGEIHKDELKYKLLFKIPPPFL